MDTIIGLSPPKVVVSPESAAAAQRSGAAAGNATPPLQRKRRRAREQRREVERARQLWDARAAPLRGAVRASKDLNPEPAAVEGTDDVHEAIATPAHRHDEVQPHRRHPESAVDGAVAAAPMPVAAQRERPASAPSIRDAESDSDESVDERIALRRAAGMLSTHDGRQHAVGGASSSPSNGYWGHQRSPRGIGMRAAASAQALPRNRSGRPAVQRPSSAISSARRQSASESAATAVGPSRVGSVTSGTADAPSAQNRLPQQVLDEDSWIQRFVRRVRGEAPSATPPRPSSAFLSTTRDQEARRMAVTPAGAGARSWGVTPNLALVKPTPTAYSLSRAGLRPAGRRGGAAPRGSAMRRADDARKAEVQRRKRLRERQKAAAAAAATAPRALARSKERSRPSSAFLSRGRHATAGHAAKGTTERQRWESLIARRLPLDSERGEKVATNGPKRTRSFRLDKSMCRTPQFQSGLNAAHTSDPSGATYDCARADSLTRRRSVAAPEWRLAAAAKRGGPHREPPPPEQIDWAAFGRSIEEW